MLYPIKECHSSKTGWEPLHHYHIGLYSKGCYTVWEVGITINLSNKLSYYISLRGVPGGRGLHFLGLFYWFHCARQAQSRTAKVFKMIPNSI